MYFSRLGYRPMYLATPMVKELLPKPLVPADDSIDMIKIPAHLLYDYVPESQTSVLAMASAFLEELACRYNVRHS